MKKILLGTTTLVGAALVSQAALADSPKVTVGGFSEFQAGHVSQDLDAGLRNHGFRSDNEISFKVDGKSDAGLGYGAEIWLEADVEDDADMQGTNASKTFVYLDGSWGRVEMGSNLGADQTLKIDASTIARGTGGIDGDFYYFVTPGTAQLIAKPDQPINYGFNPVGANYYGNESQENLNKVTYYTPKWSGFQAGISYAVDTDDRGQNVTLADTTAGQAEDIWQIGVNWTGNWDAVGLGVAATAEFGDSESALYEDLSAWQLGAKASYMGFTLAASYGDWGDSLQLKTSGSDDSDYWTAGLTYEWGAYGVGIGYIDSSYDNGTGVADTDFDNIVISADYKLAPGLTPYAEVSFFDVEAPGTANDNEGRVFLLGTQLNF